LVSLSIDLELDIEDSLLVLMALSAAAAISYGALRQASSQHSRLHERQSGNDSCLACSTPISIIRLEMQKGQEESRRIFLALFS
jgi:hypothetical protein